MNAACLTCRHARKPKGSNAGEALCILSGAPVAIGHLCMSWVGLAANSVFHNAERGQGFSSCSASTTATNSPSGEKAGGFR